MFKDFPKNRALVTLVTGAFLLVSYAAIAETGGKTPGQESKCFQIRNQARAAGLDVKRKLAAGDMDIDFARLSRLRTQMEKDCSVMKPLKVAKWQGGRDTVKKLRIEPFLIETGAGKKTLQVEIADTPKTQLKGLMFRKQMGDDEGMLFVYPVVKEITMWMKNTHLSLDMVFISENGLVSHIAYSAVPFSLDVISSNGAAKAVLEIKAGMADKLGIQVGDKVVHSAF